jgi:hypothetical protein
MAADSETNLLTSKTSCPNLSILGLNHSEETIPFPSRLQMNIQDFQNNPEERIWKGPFTFIHAADPQFGLIEKFFMKKENPKWDEEIRLSRKAIEMINDLEPKPKFLLICGDMLDTRPGTEEERELRQAQYEDFMNTFKELDPEIKIVCACGTYVTRIVFQIPTQNEKVI